MIKETSIVYRRLNWADVRDRVKSLDSRLAAVIDEVDPDPRHCFYQVDYPFGAEILKEGRLQLPGEQSMMPFSQLPVFLQEELGYNEGSNPVTFVLERSLELFINLPQRIIPYSLATPGDLFGLSKVMDPHNIYYSEIELWGMTAGARSLFMLPKITEYGAHQKLRKHLDLSIDPPAHLHDHWHLFREIARHTATEDWVTTLLYFNRHWFEHLDERSWMPFNYYLQQKMLRNTRYWRNEYLLRLLYSQIHYRCQLRPAAHIADIVRYLIHIALGALPGFIPAIDNTCGPIIEIQRLYADIYGLRYAPSIMHPGYFSLEKSASPVYASLQQPGAIELNIKGSHKKTMLTDLYEVASLLKKYLDALKHQKLEFSISVLSRLSVEVKFNYFHSHSKNYASIVSTEHLPALDPRFLNGYAGKPFAYKNHFLNGCVQIIRQTSAF